MEAFLEHVDNLVDELKENDTTISQINVEYRQNKKQKPYQLFKGEGRVNVQMDHYYFENVSEHLQYIYYQVIDPLINRVGQPFDLTLHIDQDGEIDLENLNLTFTFQVTKHQNEPEDFFKMIYRTLQTIANMHSLIHEVSVQGHRHIMNQIQFHVKASQKTISRVLRKPINTQFVKDHWVQLFDKVFVDYQKHHTFMVRTPVIQGRPKYEQRTHQFVRRVEV